MKLQIIAEVAQGYEGKHEQSKLMIKAAADAGADAVKFQLVYADELATPEYKYYDLFCSLEMSDEKWRELYEYAKSLGINLYLDIFGEKSLKLCEDLGVTTIKLHGTDITNLGLLELVAKSKIQNVLLGAGGALLSEIKIALSKLSNKNVIIFLGYQGYPTPDDSNQIARIRYIKEKLSSEKFQLGFADHAEPQTELKYALAATSLGAGATVIEKHITLGKIMKLEDHESALNPDEFAVFVNIIKTCFSALGTTKHDDDFGMSELELSYRKMIRRHVVSRVDIKKEQVLTPEKLVLKRSSIENFIYDLDSVYGKKVKQYINANQAITLDDIE